MPSELALLGIELRLQTRVLVLAAEDPIADQGTHEQRDRTADGGSGGGVDPPPAPRQPRSGRAVARPTLGLDIRPA